MSSPEGGTGSGSGSGAGSSHGSGTGTRESSGDGSSHGSGTGTRQTSGSGSGHGSGTGTRQPSGSGSEQGSGTGTCQASGSGSGHGSGSGSGHGSGSGSGSGSGTTVPAGRGSGSGSGSGSGTNAVADPINITLQVQCGHTGSGIRQEPGNPGADGTLQIVPSTGQSTDTITFTCAQIIKISATVNSGGTDAMQATIVDNAGNGVPNPQIAITQNDPPADSDWQNGMTATQNIPTPTDSGIWLGSSQPAMWKVFARGNPDDTPVVVEVQAYPSYNLSGSISMDLFKQMLSDFTDSYKQLMGSLPIQVAPQIQAPSGSLSVSSGWAENTDWQAYYGWKVTGQLNPVFGVGMKFSANALALAGMMVDVPPSITQYLGAIILSFEIDGTISLAINYGCTGPGVTSGSLSPTGGVSVTLAGQAVAGNKKVVAADITLSGTAGINWNGSFTIPSAGGVALSQNLQFTGVTASVKVTLTTFGVQSGSNVQDTFTVWQGGSVSLPSYTLIDPAATTQ